MPNSVACCALAQHGDRRGPSEQSVCIKGPFYAGQGQAQKKAISPATLNRTFGSAATGPPFSWHSPAHDVGPQAAPHEDDVGIWCSVVLSLRGHEGCSSGVRPYSVYQHRVGPLACCKARASCIQCAKMSTGIYIVSKTPIISFRALPEMKAALQDVARSQDRSVSWVVEKS